MYVVEKCEPNMSERAKEGRDWFECRVRAAWGERRVGWKEIEGKVEVEEELKDVGERGVIDGDVADEEDEIEELGLLKEVEEWDAELGDVNDEDDEVYEFDQADLEEVN